ncbi:GAF domain-containing protein [Rhodocytophaga aerolata]|uniref:GAF domain-containing protein n=1 Tax=Rhodocytophaga aerolata TaxID=455078 RepID=A0ABT8R2C5_9BACT|nr:GAF domain-containing protein [Rhodocytophaga aerolata]MDO1446074.1 GAF domain-containing protein [Rhodocytophaga aerolata]
MNSFYKKLGNIAVILFLLGIVGVTYYLYQASAQITGALQIRESQQIELVEQTVKPIFMVVGIEIFLGVSAVLFLLLNRQNTAVHLHQHEDIKTDFSSQHSHTEVVAIDKRVKSIQNKLDLAIPDATVKLEKVLSNICNELEACQGAIFQAKHKDAKRVVEMCASYAYFMAESKSIQYEFGEGLTGQVAKEGKLINISTVPDGYVTIISGLGNSSPKHLIIAPILSENTVIGVIEVASFKPFTKSDEDFFDQISPLLVELLAAQPQEEILA